MVFAKMKVCFVFFNPVTDATRLLSLISVHVCIYLQYMVAAESKLGLSGHKLRSSSWIILRLSLSSVYQTAVRKPSLSCEIRGVG